MLAPAAAAGENDTIAITADPEPVLRSPEPERSRSRSRKRSRNRAAEPEPEAEPEPSRRPDPQPPALAEPDPAPFLGERFVLQFSTGESVTVSGTGLIGRNPALEPGEFVDELVTVFDEGKSVSKTHLEFGQEDGPSG